MKYIFLLLFLGTSVTLAPAQASFTSSTFSLALDNKGRISSLLDVAGKKEYVYADTVTALLQVKTNGRWELPAAMSYDRSRQVLTFRYPSQVSLEVKVVPRDTHITFELTAAKPVNRIDRILWGSVAITIGKTVGEIIGVVRDDHFAIGIQALNIKTIGGFPFNDEGYDPTRGSAALPRKWGSVLQAYSINRAVPRTISVWNGSIPAMQVVPLPEETVVGSKIALFGVAEPLALETIGKIEVAEGLPHPEYQGKWIKQSPEQGRSYIISNFSESEVDEMITYVKRSGLMSLYHEGPFTTWGRYDFNPKYFPNGKAGVKQAVEKAHAAGIHFGVHTLTNFINTSDAYVSPSPDPRLVKTGSSRLKQAISATVTDIPVEAPDFFSVETNNNLHTVQIGQELIRYRTVTKTAPFLLVDCQRGAFGTKAAEHASGSAVSRLMDHAYEVFFPSVAMQREIAKNLALLFNETGIDHMDFDGHEGGMASGQGDYGIEDFSKTFYDHLDHFVVNGTSNSKHFYWHMNTYCNWGEPWYGGFRESMQEYRIANQALFERNYLPNMMGWYLMTTTTTLAEMEWMLARAAGYRAGFAMVLRVRDAQRNPQRDVLLDAIREWETARRAGAFSPAQRERLKNPRNEFHLEKLAEGEWRLYPYHYSSPLRHVKKELQPGEPTHSVFTFTNPDADQPLQFTLEVAGTAGAIENPVLTLDQFAEVRLPVTLQANERVVMDGTTARVYDGKGKQRAAIPIERMPALSQGSHTLKFNATYPDEDQAPEVIVMVRTKGKGEAVKGK